MTEATLRAESPSDRALIARWKEGNERAAALLVERHAVALGRFVASLGEHREVEEVVQDTFVRAFASLDGFRADSSFKTWLFAIARNLVRDRVRSRGRQPLTVAIEATHAVTEHDALDHVVADETERRMHDAIGQLSPMQRAVFTLRVADGLAYKEIAHVLGSTEGATRVHYHNAMRAIKELLDD